MFLLEKLSVPLAVIKFKRRELSTDLFLLPHNRLTAFQPTSHKELVFSTLVFTHTGILSLAAQISN